MGQGMGAIAQIEWVERKKNLFLREIKNSSYRIIL